MKAPWMALVGLVMVACAAPADSGVDEEQGDAELARSPDGKPHTALGWNSWLKHNYPDWYIRSPRSQSDLHPWGLDYDPEVVPVYAHNERFIAGVTPTTLLAVMRKAGTFSSYYSNSGPALLDGGRPVTKLELGTHYTWTTFSTPQDMEVVELDDDPKEAVLAWHGGSFEFFGSYGIEVYHRWIFRAEPGGTRVVTEECERGIGAELARFMSSALHATHELWLVQLEEHVRGRR